MICPNCKKKVPDDVKFCRYCGTRLVQQTPAVEQEPEKEPEKGQEVAAKPVRQPAGRPKWVLPAVLAGIAIIAIIAFFALTGSDNKVKGLGGTWQGSGDGMTITFTLSPSCQLNTVCGTFDIPIFPVSGEVVFVQKDGNAYEFVTQNMSDGQPTNAFYESLEVLPDGKMRFYSDGPDWHHDFLLTKIE